MSRFTRRQLVRDVALAEHLIASKAAAATLPEGVVARHLTVGGAAVDVVDTRGGAQVTCQGCGWSATSRGSASVWDAAREAAGRNAQGHAATCTTPAVTA